MKTFPRCEVMLLPDMSLGLGIFILLLFKIKLFNYYQTKSLNIIKTSLTQFFVTKVFNELVFKL